MLSAKSAPLAATPSGRLSYARIAEVRDGVSVDKFEVPNLIELQLESFEWFIEKGLRELFDEISPIKDFTGKVMELQFRRLRVRDAEVLRGGVPDRTSRSPAALRERRAPDQGDRRDQAPARLHGRLPVDDGHGHVRHQRRRARRRQPARALARRVLQRGRGPGDGPDAVLGQADPEPRRLARVRDQQQGPAVGQGRPQAQDRRRRPCSARSATRPNDEIAGLFGAVDTDPEHPFIATTLDKDLTKTPQRGADRGLQDAAPGRPAHR